MPILTRCRHNSKSCGTKAEATRVNEEAMRLFRLETEGATKATTDLNAAKAQDPDKIAHEDRRG